MATHQALSGVTDEAFLQRMVRTYAERFGASFWDFFTAHVAPRLPHLRQAKTCRLRKPLIDLS